MPLPGHRSENPVQAAIGEPAKQDRGQDHRQGVRKRHAGRGAGPTDERVERRVADEGKEPEQGDQDADGERGAVDVARAEPTDELRAPGG